MTHTVSRGKLPHNPLLGRHVNHDERSKRYAFQTRNLEITPVRHKRHAPIWDQGSVGSCTGNAGMGCLATGLFFDTTRDLGLRWTEDEAVGLYSEATAIDPWEGTYPPEDTGSDGLSIAKVLKRRGWISGYQHTFSLTDALKALSVTPLITGINWYSSFWQPREDGLVTIEPGARVEGGHEIVVDEYQSGGVIGFTNSWGESWGVSGRFYMRTVDYQRLLDEDGDVTVFVPRTLAPPEPQEPELTELEKFAAKVRPWAERGGLPCWGASGARKATRAYLKSQGLL